jgi:GAF domain-containing protein
VQSSAIQAKEATLRDEVYREIRGRIDGLVGNEDDWIAAMATIVCELYQAFDHYHWTGFYRVSSDRTLVIGPFQGMHGCLRIDVSRGVCGAAVRSRQTQLVDDVEEFPGHIACDPRTRSEIVVPVKRPDGSVFAVLDIDSNDPAAFTEVDREHLEDLCSMLGAKYGDELPRH